MEGTASGTLCLYVRVVCVFFKAHLLRKKLFFLSNKSYRLFSSKFRVTEKNNG